MNPRRRRSRRSRAAARHADGTALEIGAGTVLSIEAAERAVDAGATFLVSPHVDPELIEWAADRGIPFIPGAFTPTEILAAWRAGAPAVKFFPASVAGPDFIRDFRGPFPHIPLLPTGGVTVKRRPTSSVPARSRSGSARGSSATAIRQGSPAVRPAWCAPSKLREDRATSSGSR